MTRFALALLFAGLSLPVCAQDASAPSPVPVPEAPAAALPPAPGPDDGRYTFHRAPDGFVRLDSRTGQVSTCALAGTGWACQAAPDERVALESEIGRLQGDNTALKKELLARGLALPSGVKADPSVAKAPETPPEAKPSLKTPSDAELDNAMAFLEKVWRRMVEMMANMQREMQRKN